MTAQSTRSNTPTPSLTQRHRTEKNATDAAVRLVTETAHELRSPLTAVRESIRSVRDGDLGPVNDDQQSFLDSAVDQCGCIEQVVGEMVRLERLRAGNSRVQRGWVPVTEIRQAVDEALLPRTVPAGVELLWDGADDPDLFVFADAKLLRQLLVNLISDSIRVTSAGGFVLIRLARIHHGDAVCWSVVDRGPSRGDQDVERFYAAESTASRAGGEGVGLAVSQQLAAQHFSPLKIRSRPGKGTQVSFETATGGPRGVARHWTRWRLGALDAPDQMRRSTRPSSKLVSESNDRRIRFDVPAILLTLSHVASRPVCQDLFMAGTVALGGTVSSVAANQFDQVLQAKLNNYDLSYRVDTRRWVWCFDADADSVRRRLESLEDLATSCIPGIRMKWSPPQVMKLDTHRTAGRISDLLVRQFLDASQSPMRFDPDEVRPGTAPIAPSNIAEIRLDAEVRRLRKGLGQGALPGRSPAC